MAVSQQINYGAISHNSCAAASCASRCSGRKHYGSTGAIWRVSYVCIGFGSAGSILLTSCAKGFLFDDALIESNRGEAELSPWLDLLNF